MVHELTPRLLDAISGTGEMLAAPLVAAAIAARGKASQAVDATELIVTTDQYGGAEPLMDETRAKTARAPQARDRPRRHSRRHRIHRRDRRRRDDDARTRRVGLLGVDRRRRARCRRSVDLDRRRRRHDGEPVGSPRGADARGDFLQRSVRAGVLRRQGAALQDDPAGVPPAHSRSAFSTASTRRIPARASASKGIRRRRGSRPSPRFAA